MPWSQATGTGDNYIERHPIECADLNDGNRIKKIYFDITITRNDDGTLASIEVPLPSYEANRGAFCDCYGTMTYTWKDGRPTHKAWTVMSMRARAGILTMPTPTSQASKMPKVLKAMKSMAPPDTPTPDLTKTVTGPSAK